MNGTSSLLTLAWLLAASAPGGDRETETTQAWGHWRGPEASGVASHGQPPVEWSEDKNVRWKTVVPGHGLSTPIVWGDLVYLQTAVPVNPEKADESAEQSRPRRDGEGRREGRDRRREGRGEDGNDAERGPRGDRRGGPHGEGRRGPGRWNGMRRAAPTDPYKFNIMAFDRKTGKQVWEHTLRQEVPHEGNHRDGSLAPASPVTDGKHLFAYFGSRGLFCLTMTGEVVWEKGLGDMQTRNGFGEGSSPVLHGDTVVVNWDHEGDSFIVALDKTNGNEKWRRERDEVTSWSTPLILANRKRPQVVVSATKRVRSYDLATGETVWECGGLGLNCIPCPVAADGLVFAMSGYRNSALLAIRHDGATGDLTDSEAVAWKLSEGTPYVPSPLLYEDTLYFLQRNSGILSCHDPKTGKPHYDKQRLDKIDGVYASPVGAAGRVYIVGRNGATYVLKRSHSFETLAINKLDDEFTASPAIVGNELYLRGRKHLYCIAAE